MVIRKYSASPLRSAFPRSLAATALVAIGLTAFVAIALSSCMKLTQVPPASTQLTTPAVFSSDQQAQASIAGLYTSMMTHPRWLFNGAISLYPALSGDELQLTMAPVNPAEYGFALDTLSSANALCSGLYGAAYSYVNTANAILQGLSASTAVSAGMRTWIQGQAEFSRAFSYFYLVNLFGDVPLVTRTDYTENETIGRTSSMLVYNKIVEDLLDAQQLLPEQYTGSLTNPNDRIYPNKMAATALLARVYLYLGNSLFAEQQATNVIADSALYGLEALDKVFLPSSREAIWQLQPVNKYLYLNTGEANIFLPFSPFLRPVYALDSGLLKAFETGDQRKAHWVATRKISGVNYNYPYKYKVSAGQAYSEYNTVLRLAEQYLIRAEARVTLGDLNGAAADLDTIRTRAGLGAVGSTDKDSLMAAIYRERQTELFAEWGHRWFDLKRSGQIDSVMKVARSGWDAHDALYPIPVGEIQLNPRLVQNPGY